MLRSIVREVSETLTRAQNLGEGTKTKTKQNKKKKKNTSVT